MQDGARAFDTLLRMCSDLISDPKEHFSKFLLVSKIFFRRPCEARESYDNVIE